MEDERFNNEFDDFLKKRYENHTIEPDRRIWEDINMRLSRKSSTWLKTNARKLVITASAIAAAVTGILIFVDQTNHKHDNVIATIPAGVAIFDSGIISEQNISVMPRPDRIKEQNGNNRTVMSGGDSFDRKDYYIASSSHLTHGKDSTGNYLFSEARGRITGESQKTDKGIGTADRTIPVKRVKRDGSNIMTERFDLYNPELMRSLRSGIITAHLNKRGLIALRSSGEGSSGSITTIKINNENYYSFATRANKGPGRFPLFIEGSASPEISYRFISSNSRYSIPDFGKSYFNRTEKADVTFSAGLTIGTGINNIIAIKSGIYMSRYSYRIRTEGMYLYSDSTTGKRIYTSSGAVRVILASSDTISKESLMRSSVGFSYLNIPLSAELRLKQNYFISLGLTMNILIGQAMNWQAENYQGDFSNVIADPVEGLERFTVSLLAGIGKEVYVTRKLSLILSPQVKIYLTSVSNSAPVRSYPYAFGLNAGLRYYFD